MAAMTRVVRSCEETFFELYPRFKQDMAAIGEGFCPAGHGPLRPVEVTGAQIGGHCAECQRYYWTDPAGPECGWMLDHHQDGSYRPPVRTLY